MLQEWFLVSSPATVCYRPKQYVTEDSMESVRAGICNLRYRKLTATESNQQLWTKKFRYDYFYNEKVIKDFFVEGEIRSIFERSFSNFPKTIMPN